MLEQLSDFERDSLLLEITRLGHVSAFERDRVLADFSAAVDRST